MCSSEDLVLYSGGSNFDWHAGYSECGFLQFSSALCRQLAEYNQSDHDHFLPKSFRFITHQLPQYITLSIPGTDTVVDYITKQSNSTFYRNEEHVLDSQFLYFSGARSILVDLLYISRHYLTYRHIKTRKNYRGIAHINVQDET